PLLGETRAIDDENGVGVADLLLDVAPQLGQDVVVTPAAGADEQLEGPAVEGGGGGDGLGGLAVQAGELAAQDDEGVRPLLGAGEVGQVALAETLQVVQAAVEVGRVEFGVGEEGLRRGVLQDVHDGAPEKGTAVNLAKPTPAG